MLPLTYRLQFQPGITNKVSHVPPYNLFTVYVIPNSDAVLFQCRVSQSNGKIPYHGVGVAIKEIDNPSMNVEFSFQVDAIDAFPTEGLWDIAFYLQYSDGSWSDVVAFKVLIPPEKTDIQPMITKDDEDIWVIREFPDSP